MKSARGFTPLQRITVAFPCVSHVHQFGIYKPFPNKANSLMNASKVSINCLRTRSVNSPNSALKTCKKSHSLDHKTPGFRRFYLAFMDGVAHLETMSLSAVLASKDICKSKTSGVGQNAKSRHGMSGQRHMEVS